MGIKQTYTNIKETVIDLNRSRKIWAPQNIHSFRMYLVLRVYGGIANKILRMLGWEVMNDYVLHRPWLWRESNRGTQKAKKELARMVEQAENRKRSRKDKV